MGLDFDDITIDNSEYNEGKNSYLNEFIDTFQNFLTLIKEEQENNINITKVEINLKWNYELEVKKGDVIYIWNNKVLIEEIENNKLIYIVIGQDLASFDIANFWLIEFWLSEDNIDEWIIVDGELNYINWLFWGVNFNSLELINTLLSEQSEIYHWNDSGKMANYYWKICDNNLDSLKEYIKNMWIRNLDGIKFKSNSKFDIDLWKSISELELYFMKNLPDILEKRSVLEWKIIKAEFDNNRQKLDQQLILDSQKAQDLINQIKSWN